MPSPPRRRSSQRNSPIPDFGNKVSKSTYITMLDRLVPGDIEF